MWVLREEMLKCSQEEGKKQTKETLMKKEEETE